jgi:hypothetical protein
MDWGGLRALPCKQWVKIHALKSVRHSSIIGINGGRAGTPISGRYGDCAGADGAAEVLEIGVSGNGWEEPVRSRRRWGLIL